MDETLPLLPDQERDLVAECDEGTRKDIVDFDPNGDAENPTEWPAPYKWGIVVLLALMAFTVTFTCTSVVPIANRIVDDLDGAGSSKSASVLLVTIWELGEAAGPLFIGPLSEVFGRYPVINGANLLFVGSVVLAALCRSSAVFVASRVLTGLAVATNVLGPAIIGDMFPPERRGTAMSFVHMAPLVGGAVGPAVSGAVAESVGWRRVMWLSAALAALCELVFLSCFRETYRVPILRRRAARLRRATGNPALRTVFDLDRDDGKRGAARIYESVMRPAIVFASSGVLQALALFGSITFSFFYVISVSLPDILSGIYGLTPAMTGTAFIVFSIGSLASAALCNLTLDPIYVKLRAANKGAGRPEYRLPLVIAGGLLLPFFLAMYGWTAQLRLSLAFELVCFGLVATGLTLSILPVMTYLVDAFGIYSASAMTALIVTRCLVGTFLPLAVHPLADRLGYGGAFTVLAALGLCVAPIPAVVLRYGPRLRQRSPYTRDD